MEKCDICGKECRTAQGLGGHKRWVHGVAPSGAQLRLEQPNPLITKSVLEQLLDERFAVIAEQVDALSGELAEQVKTLSGEQQQGEQQSELIKQMEQRLSAAEHKTIDDFTPREKAEFLIPWLQGLDEEDFFTLARGTGHDVVPDPAVVTVLAETFRKQEEEAKVIQGKTSLPGYRYLENLDMSIFVGEEELDKERMELIEATISKGFEQIGGQLVNRVKIATELVTNLAESQRRLAQAKRKR